MNIMEVKFSAKSENESLARVIVASFAAKLDPTIDELSDIKQLYLKLLQMQLFTDMKKMKQSLYI